MNPHESLIEINLRVKMSKKIYGWSRTEEKNSPHFLICLDRCRFETKVNSVTDVAAAVGILIIKDCFWFSGNR